MWRALASLPTQITALLVQLRELAAWTAHQTRLQQETNLLLRELLTHLSTHGAETLPTPPLRRPDPTRPTYEAELLALMGEMELSQRAMPSAPSTASSTTASASPSPSSKRPVLHDRLRTEHDVTRVQRSDLDAIALRRLEVENFPHRDGEVLPPPPPPVGGPPTGYPSRPRVPSIFTRRARIDPRSPSTIRPRSRRRAPSRMPRCCG